MDVLSIGHRQRVSSHFLTTLLDCLRPTLIPMEILQKRSGNGNSLSTFLFLTIYLCHIYKHTSCSICLSSCAYGITVSPHSSTASIAVDLFTHLTNGCFSF